ncbi:phage portal protein [Parerythrobacter jejuensis]|uniref:Phage portal protein n=1 Tax=Parerythrobacter jejuensis TaxID=795812 RepID=A0A845AMB2_9SPHN|nr:phage portal protein [Parerythrobacter jejuensis]MXP30754.1 phage portal protein [Parerythrobacter jejuensis]MXP33514.1 phage portal protein [Parerythrobacter jejuensis]
MSFLSSLTSAFKGGGGSRVPVARGFVSPWATAFEGSARRPFDYGASLREAFVENPVAQRAVRIVAEGVGSAPLAQSDPKLAALLIAPSAGQSLVETLALHLLLHGNAYCQIAKDASGRPIELYALRPERVSVVPGDDGWPSAYAYRLADRTLTIPLEDDGGWPNIIHLKSLHPGDDHYGAGCLSAARQAVAIHNAASEWNRALLANSARPSGALIHATDDSGGLSSDQFDRLKAELEQAFSGKPNAGRPMLLEGGLSWQSMAMSPADMDFATLKEAAARDIALAFGVPPMLLGLPGDNTYANYREANRALWRLTLLPLAAKILGGLTDGLSPWFNNTALAVDLDRIPALSEDRERLWSQVSEASFLTDAEKREMLGLPAEGSTT